MLVGISLGTSMVPTWNPTELFTGSSKAFSDYFKRETTSLSFQYSKQHLSIINFNGTWS